MPLAANDRLDELYAVQRLLQDEADRLQQEHDSLLEPRGRLRRYILSVQIEALQEGDPDLGTHFRRFGKGFATLMSEFWKQWENQVINGQFPLRRFLGASSHSAVFLTEYEASHGTAAIKFIRADTPHADMQLARWRAAAAALSHPHLIRLHGLGPCRLGSHELLFVVMEYAEQSLAQILVQARHSTKCAK